MGAIPRREWDLWPALGASGIGRVPAFGDYAVQHPYPPHDSTGNNGRANIRYTAGNETLVARGSDPRHKKGRSNTSAYASNWSRDRSSPAESTAGATGRSRTVLRS